MSNLQSDTYIINSDQHHTFSVHLAAKFGIECAILIHHFQHWIEHNKRLGRNFFDGRTWTYQTLKEIAAHYPYLNEFKVCRLLKKLVDAGVLIKGNYNKSKFDQTQWYAFKNEKMFTTLQNCNMDVTEVQNPDDESAIPIPHTKTHTRTNKQTYADQVDASKSNFSKKSNSKNPVILRQPRRMLVSTSEEEHQKLVDKYGLSITEKCYDYLQEWKLSKSETDVKSLSKHTDYFRITKWVRKALDELDGKNPADGNYKSSRIEENLKLSKDIEAKFHSPTWKIEVLSKQIEFVSPGNFQPICINYSENGFKEQLGNALRKCNFRQRAKI